MNDFLYLYGVYEKITRRSVSAKIFQSSGKPQRGRLWALSVLLARNLLVSALIPSTSYATDFIVAIIAFVIFLNLFLWVKAFYQATETAFQEVHQTRQKNISHYSKDFQYLRYWLFRQELGSKPSMSSIDNAIKHVNIQIDTEFSSPTFSHPLISLQIGVALAVMGGLFGQVHPSKSALIVLGSVVSIYLSTFIIDITRTPAARLKEFKRFLLWLREDEMA